MTVLEPSRRPSRERTPLGPIERVCVVLVVAAVIALVVSMVVAGGGGVLNQG